MCVLLILRAMTTQWWKQTHDTRGTWTQGQPTGNTQKVQDFFLFILRNRDWGVSYENDGKNTTLLPQKNTQTSLSTSICFFSTKTLTRLLLWACLFLTQISRLKFSQIISLLFLLTPKMQKKQVSYGTSTECFCVILASL